MILSIFAAKTPLFEKEIEVSNDLVPPSARRDIVEPGIPPPRVPYFLLFRQLFGRGR